MRYALASLLLLAACETPCTDRDGDGFGLACAMGVDCDDEDASRALDCETIPPPDCEADPNDTGCPCLPGAVTACFPIEGAMAGAGPCRAGRAICRSSHWGLCTGVVGPGYETCDESDDDCDGRIDEGTRSPCGGCRDDCRGGVWGEVEAPFEPTELLERTPYGELTLVRSEHAASTLWVANSAEGTVSRIDGASGTETARYPSSIVAFDAAPREPSRIAVDWAGDAWVANRAFEGQGSVTKIAGELSRCIDRDGNGTIETSTGGLDVRAGDECVLFTVPVGDPVSVPRALAIDGGGLDGTSFGNAWVGLFEGHAVVELDGRDGHELRRVDIEAFSPYGAAVDPWGTVWMMSRDGYLARIDPRLTEPVVEMIEVPLACWLLYSIAVDGDGRIGLTGFSCDQVAVYDPTTGSIARVSTEPSTRGAVFAPDGALWVAHTAGLVSELSVMPLAVRHVVDLRVGDAFPSETIGMGADTIGHVWAVSRDGGEDGAGLVSRIELPSGDVSATIPTGRAPHTQGDLTGVMLEGAFVPEGSTTRVFDGCETDGPTMWGRLHLEGREGSAGTIEVEVRRAEDRAGLAAEVFESLGTWPGTPSPYALSLTPGGVVEVRVTLRAASRLGAPRLRRVGVEWRCNGPD